MNDPKLSILHVDTERGWRGGERQAFWLATSLARRGHGTLVAARPGEPLAQRVAEAGLDVVACAPRFEADPVAAFKLRRVIRGRGVDVVHAHTGHAVAIAALATIGTDARMVVTRRVDFRLRPNVASRWKYSRADAIIAISKAVAGALAESGVQRDRITIVPSGIDLSRRFTPATAETLAAAGVNVGKPLVVQVSQLVGHKDPLTFVRAIAAVKAKIPDVQALLVGEGSLRPAVEAEVARLGLDSSLHLTGYRPDADSLLAAADVVTLSSREEGLGTVILDALSMGKPVAATSGGGIPEMLRHGVSGMLSQVGDHASLAEDIGRILNSEELRKTLSANARVRAAEFSVERTAEKTLEVYREVVTRGGRGPRRAFASR